MLALRWRIESEARRLLWSLLSMNQDGTIETQKDRAERKSGKQGASKCRIQETASK